MLYLALEKRYNFSMDDLDVVANGYAHFRSFLKDAEGKILKTNNCREWCFTFRLRHLISMCSLRRMQF